MRRKPTMFAVVHLSDCPISLHTLKRCSGLCWNYSRTAWEEVILSFIRLLHASPGLLGNAVLTPFFSHGKSVIKEIIYCTQTVPRESIHLAKVASWRSTWVSHEADGMGGLGARGFIVVSARRNGWGRWTGLRLAVWIIRWAKRLPLVAWYLALRCLGWVYSDPGYENPTRKAVGV